MRDGLSLRRASAGTFAVKLAETGLALGVTASLTRLLGPAGFGTYAFALTIVFLASVPAQAGLPPLVVRETSKAAAADRWGQVDRLWAWSGATGLLVGVVVAGLVMLLAWPLSPPAPLGVLAGGLPLVPLLALTAVRAAALRGLRRMVLGQLLDTVARPAVFLLLIGLAAMLTAPQALTPVRAMLLHTAAAALALALATWRLRVAGKGARARAIPDPGQPAAWRRAAVPMGLVASLQVLNTSADVVMLGVLADDADVGIYRVAAQAAALVSFGLVAVNVAIGPQVARDHAAGRHHDLQRLVTASARGAFAFALVSVTVLLAAGGWLLSLFAGPAFAAGATSLKILALGQLVNAGMGSVGLLLQMTGHERDTLRNVAVAAGGNVALNLALIPAFGTAGAATATALTFVLWNGLLWRAVHRRLGIESSALGTRRR